MHIPTRPLSFGPGEWFDHAVISFDLGLVLLAIDLAERRAFTKGALHRFPAPHWPLQ